MKNMDRQYVIALILAVFMGMPAWSVWEGNAGVAADSQFPGSGLYALSDMFPKNTLVEIQNLETDKKVRAVITGSSGVPGLVVLLSSETADALGVRPGSVSRVRILLPSTVSELSATGSNSLSSGTTSADPDNNPALAAAAATPDPLLTKVIQKPADPLIPVAEVPEDKTKEVPTPISTSETNTLPVTSSEPKSISATTEPAKDVVPSIESEKEKLPSDDDKTVGQLSVETPIVIADSPSVTDVSVPINTELPLPNQPVSTEPATVVTADAVVPPVPPSDTPIASGVIEPKLDIFAPVGRTSEPKSQTVFEEPSVEVKKTELIPADAIVTLEPAPAKPPVVVDNTGKDRFPVVEEIKTPATPVLPKVSIAEATLKIQTEPAEINDRTLFPLIEKFSVGSYYVQLASYSTKESVVKLIDSYGKKYPIGVEQAQTEKGTIFKVFIGPVNKDEYGAVLEQFRKLGFKDAFIKKVQ